MPNMRTRRRAARVGLPASLFACAALLAVAPGAALAQSRPDWPDGARRTGAAEYVAAGTLTLSTYLLGLYRPTNYRTTGPWLFDLQAREALRIPGRDARITADTVSDVLLWTVLAYPLADALLAATALRAREPVPIEMAVQTSLVLSATAALTYFTKGMVGRERPVAGACRAHSGHSSECGADAAPVSFWSGHAAASFAAATMACVHHQELDLYGDETADALACAVPLGVASAVALLRVMADQHYATDVIVGAAAGALSGLGLGLLLHY
jgi:membrane-associated phospholipid phosphatase